MDKPRICAVIVDSELEAVKGVEPLVDLFEVRIDRLGDGWQEIARQLKKPWIACNRIAEEGGSWRGDEARRIETLLSAVELGADTVDLELRTKDAGKIVKQIKGRAKCLLSYHDLQGTPPMARMREIIRQQLDSGADVCKLVTTARSLEDNLSVLQLISDFARTRIVALAMGPLGLVSRILCPLVGGDFTYASIEEGKESASGQITVSNLRKIYSLLSHGK